MFSNKLPVPDTRLYLYNATRDGLLKMLQDHMGIFVQNQDKRQALFEQNIQLKWTTKEADILEEDIKFREGLKKFQAQAERIEASHAETFAQDQQLREKDFWAAEQKREREFLETTKENQDNFIEKMKSMEKKFYTQLQELVDAAYSGESFRVAEAARFEAVQMREIQEELFGWKRKFATARENRQAKVTELLQKSQ